MSDRGWRVAGWITVTIGVCMIIKGTDLNTIEIPDDVIDIDFEIID